jgi:4-hydroxy-2-oxoheptanedioate aldolase
LPLIDLPRNQFKRAIAELKPQVGLWSSLGSGTVAEMMAQCGFDWILIDTEHSPNEVPDILAQLQALRGGTATPIVRVAWNDPVLVKRALDCGVQTILFPLVQTAEEAKRAVASTRYPPGGIRGVAGSTRAAGYGRTPDYLKRADSEMCVLVQVENRTGVQNLEAIAAVEGVDGVFIGPNDLAAALDHLGDIKHPDVQAAINGVLGKLKALRKPAGYLTYNVADAKQRFADGFTFVAVSSDITILQRGGDELVKTFKS